MKLVGRVARKRMGLMKEETTGSAATTKKGKGEC
jgi:hypothetical protein